MGVTLSHYLTASPLYDAVYVPRERHGESDRVNLEHDALGHELDGDIMQRYMRSTLSENEPVRKNNATYFDYSGASS
jgi:hypothetical protein